MIQPKWDNLAESTQSRVLNESSGKQQLHDAYIAGYNRALREARSAAPAPAWLEDVPPPPIQYPNNQQQNPALLMLPDEPINGNGTNYPRIPNQQNPALLMLPERPIDGVAPGRGIPSQFDPQELLMLPERNPYEDDFGGTEPGTGFDPYSWQAGG